MYNSTTHRIKGITIAIRSETSLQVTEEAPFKKTPRAKKFYYKKNYAAWC
jgi:hypothetical protein